MVIDAMLDVAPVPKAATLSCPSCGASIVPRAHGWALTVVCDSCSAVLDASDASLRVLQQQERQVRVAPLLTLGSRGTWRGVSWEMIGFQVVTITVDGVDYSWSEYVAFNPYRGFLYLSEYQGHWNVIDKLHTRPQLNESSSRPTATLNGRTYKHFQTAQARTTFALGEFPWALRVGDRVMARDYIAPPYVLSAEATDGETTWSLGTYTASDIIAKAFPHAASMPSPHGVYANQPNPYDNAAAGIGKRVAAMLAVLVIMLLANMALSQGSVAFSKPYTYVHATEDSAAFVTPAFELEGRPSSVTVDIATDADNDWAFFSFSLINEATGVARDFSQQVSYYHGNDSDGSWSEGARNESIRVASVPAGRYFLRVAPEGGESTNSQMHYTMTVRRDAPSFVFYLLAALALLIPAVLVWVQKASFESKRLQESDYATEADDSSDSGDDE